MSSKFHPEYSGSGHRARTTAVRLRDEYGLEYEVLTNGVEQRSNARYRVDGLEVRRVISAVRRLPLVASLPGKLGAAAAHVARAGEARATFRWLESGGYDLVHVVGNSASTAAAMLFAARRGVPAIVELVNVSSVPRQHLRFFRGLTDADLKKLFFVAISPRLYETCREHGVQHRTWFRPNPVDADHFRPPTGEERDASRRRLGVGDDDKLLVYLGEFRALKNHPFLLDVLEHLDDRWRLALAGPLVTSGPEAVENQTYYEKVVRSAERFGQRVVVLEGFMETRELLSGADVYLQPSFNEAFGTVVLEALAMGLPVVVNSGESGMRSIAATLSNVAGVPLDAQAWSEAVRTKGLRPTADAARAGRDGVTRIAGAQVVYGKYAQLIKALAAGAVEEAEQIIQPDPLTGALLAAAATEDR